MSPHTLAGLQHPAPDQPDIGERKRSTEAESIQLSLHDDVTPLKPANVPASDAEELKIDQEQMLKAVVPQDAQKDPESFREKLNIKQLTFAKNDSNGSILEIKKFGQAPIRGHATSNNIAGKKKGLKIRNSGKASPLDQEAIGAEILRSSKHRPKKGKNDPSAQSGYVPSHVSASPRQGSLMDNSFHSISQGQKNSLNVKNSTAKGKFLNSKKPSQTHHNHSSIQPIDSDNEIKITKWN